MINIFSKIYQEYGVSNSFEINKWKLFYLNGKKLKIGNYYFPSDGTAINRTKELSIRKSYSEYLERFRLGIGGYTDSGVHITYGENDVYGYIDTTGTATGTMSSQLIYKGLSELIEKNELFLFWYTSDGERLQIQLSPKELELIRDLNFIAIEHKIFAIRNLSNFYTVIVISFSNKQITGCGIACENSIEVAVEKAILENKLSEWQHYKNPNSKFYSDTCQNIEAIYDYINYLSNHTQQYLCHNYDSVTQNLVLEEKIQRPEIVLLGKSQCDNEKTVKLVSRYLLNCIPSKEYLLLSTKQLILKGIDFNSAPMDCLLI
ncbi:YcaO-like family protein [Enterococcus caccae]|uniref:YcaO-like family protein n=1 Tax=Enterococcus caccae TaxID=317735 RepID=UPI00039F843F|nr:YcaO-like family protein [Enterococcus caccae]OJG26724.1 hypothetical protein RU98_GL000514 [Enterococcus caccae]